VDEEEQDVVDRTKELTKPPPAPWTVVSAEARHILFAWREVILTNEKPLISSLTVEAK
jgi:hypothetical protein